MLGSNNTYLAQASEFISEYIGTLMGCGVHTSRVVRNTNRIAKALDVEVHLSVFHRTVILAVRKDGEAMHSEIVEIPNLPINFRFNSELSALSWEAYDHHLPLHVVKEKFDRIVSTPRFSHNFMLFMAGAANASFCHLFGGDWLSTLIVFIATLVGFTIKALMHKHMSNLHFTVIVTAFVSSIIAGVSVLFDTTTDIAITTSVLFLIPGVPLINGVIDVMEGYILTGFARLAKAFIIILCIAVGLAMTLWIVKNQLI